VSFGSRFDTAVMLGNYISEYLQPTLKSCLEYCITCARI